jgi:hypothetical protein
VASWRPSVVKDSSYGPTPRLSRALCGPNSCHAAAMKFSCASKSASTLFSLSSSSAFRAVCARWKAAPSFRAQSTTSGGASYSTLTRALHTSASGTPELASSADAVTTM